MLDKRVSYAILGGFLILMLISIYYIRFINFDFTYEVFFPKDDPDREYYNEFIQRFEPDGNFVAIAVENPDGNLEPEFLNTVHEITLKARKLPYVSGSESITTIERPVFVAGRPMTFPLLNIENPQLSKADQQRILSDSRLINRLVSNDGRAIAILLTVEDIKDTDASLVLDDSLSALLDNYDLNFHIAGKPYYQSQLAKQTGKEFRNYTIISILLIILALYLMFRRLRIVAVAFLSVVVSMVLFFGFVGLTGYAIDPVSSLFPIILIVVSVSYSIHILSKYLEDAADHPKKEALKKTIKEVGLATFLTSVTTGIGFSSLASTSIPSIKNFGLYAAAGVMMSFITVITFTPSLVNVLQQKKFLAKPSTIKTGSMWMERLYYFNIKNQLKIIIAFLLLILISIAGILNIGPEAHFSSYFPSGEVKEDFEYFEKHFGGIRNFELGVILKDDAKVTDLQVLQDLNKLEEYIENHPGISAVLGPATILKTMNQAYKGEIEGSYALPEDKETVDELYDVATYRSGGIVKNIISKNNDAARITARIEDVGLEENLKISKDLNQFIDNNLDTSIAEYKQTGYTFLMDKNIIYGRSNLLWGLALAFVIISILMALLFRNYKMVFISLIPNIIPVLFAGAIIGFSGIEMTISVTIVFAIAFGIAVDDTIHFLSKFKLELAAVKNVDLAIKNSLRVTGKALVMTTIVLIMAFGILVTSSYPATFYIGLLMTITLVTALLADLLLLPILIRLLIKDQ